MAKYRVEITGINTSKLKVLTNEEMIELFKRYQNGDEFAKDDLISGNLKLVLSILKGYSNRTDNMDDLFQVGCVGLIKAIDNFDLSHEVKFSTYAVPMILGEVKRYLRDNNGVRVTRSLKDIAYKGLKVKEELTNKLNREPTIKEIADKLELTEYEVNQAFEAMRDTISMSEPIYNEGGDTIYLSEQIADNKQKVELDMIIMLKEALKSLKDKERFIIYKRYFEGITQMELSEEIGISQAQISRIEKNSLETMKKLIK
ncbi:MAG: SigB/SigF/SigG family RNA polymerase sigma factor [Bacilli bacterium]|nr:SigB/SigF/SigG family RNA polymerase sigma factor [Bacilli bacterium]